MNISVDKIRNTLHSDNSTNLVAIGLMITGVSLFASSDILFRFLSGNLGPVELAFWNDIFALIVTLVLFHFFGGLNASLKTKHLKMHLARSAGLTVGWMCLLASFAHMPVANTYSITFLWPILAVLLSIIFLKEQTNRIHWISLALGIAGILVILKPGFGTVSEHMIWPFLATLGFATGNLFARKIPKNEPFLSFALYPIIVVLLVTIPYMIFHFQMPTSTEFGILMITSILGALGVTCVGMAFSLANTAVVAPFEYVKMFWAVVLGYIVFGDVLDPLTAFGALLIIASGLIIMLNEKKRNPGRQKAQT